MKNLLIIGARGFGRALYNAAKCCILAGEDMQITGFLDDKPEVLDGFKNYPPIVSSVEDYQIKKNDVFICALGNPIYKKKYVDMIKSKGGRFLTLIHPTAHVGDNTVLGEGCILGINSHICQDVLIGDFVTLDGYASIAHDAKVGSFSHIGTASTAAGSVEIGEMVLIHPGCRIVPHRKVGDRAIVGVGSVVIKNVKADTTVFGNPAKVL